MLKSVKELEGYPVSAAGGDSGKIVSFLLENERWIVRYLLVELEVVARQVLISPMSLAPVASTEKCFALALTADEVGHSPLIDLDEPVSRRHELELSRYYGTPPYWGQAGTWGSEDDPSLLADSGAGGGAESEAGVDGLHLRSIRELRGFQVQGDDENIGHVEDVIVDVQTWQVRYLVVDTRTWWFGNKALVAPSWARSVDWSSRQIHVDFSRAAIKEGPVWRSSVAIDRALETQLHDYYGMPGYWVRVDERAEAPRPVAPRSSKRRAPARGR